MKNLFNIVIGVSLISIAFITSCKPEVEPTIAVVKVVDFNGDPVAGADVILACTSSINQPCEVEIIGKSDANGIFTKEFELPVVLQVLAAGNIFDTIIKGVPPNVTITYIQDTICGATFISVKPEQTSTQTIILYDCK